MHRIGARIWIARIMITWGLLSALFAFVQTPTQFYVLRFLLGLAEAGFYPGVILYLTYWFPSHRRAKIIAVFMSAIPVSGIFGNPLSGWIMERFHGGSGFHGWQWMFMIEAVPAVLVGIATILYLDNSIRSAKWLDEREKQLLEDEIAAQPQEQQKHGHSLKAVFADPRMWWMSLIYFAFVTGQYGHVLDADARQVDRHHRYAADRPAVGHSVPRRDRRDEPVRPARTSAANAAGT